MTTDRKDYSYGSQGHIDLAIEAMKCLMTLDLYRGKCTVTERCELIAIEAFCMAEAMIKQIESL